LFIPPSERALIGSNLGEEGVPMAFPGRQLRGEIETAHSVRERSRYVATRACWWSWPRMWQCRNPS